MVVDASTIVGAALKQDSIPRQALLLARPKFEQAITAEVRAEIVGLLTAAAAWIPTTMTVTDCRDPKDNKIPGAGR